MMYSKAGKVSVELFPWIQQKDSIINGEKKKTYQISIFDEIPHSKRITSQPKQKKLLNEEQLPKTPIQPFSKQVGRKDPRKELDRYGFYKPKYHLVQKKSPLTDSPDHFKQISSDRSLSQKSNKRITIQHTKTLPKHNCDVSKEYKDKIQLQEEKKKMIQQNDGERFPLPEGPNEHRFDYIEYPQSQYHRSPNPVIRPRSNSSKVLKKEQKNGQIYDLNYTVIYAKSDKMIPVLDKLTPRAPFNSDKPIYTFHETLADDTPKKKPQSFLMDQQLSRDKALSHYNSIRRLYYL